MIDSIEKAMGQVRHPAFHRDERAYQGELLVGLARFGILPAEAIVQQEAQKTLLHHGLRLRPDVIIHRPAVAGQDRRLHNYGVFELKRGANEHDAALDFESLDEMIRLLHYEHGFFINIGSEATFANVYQGGNAARITFFATTLIDGAISIVREWFERGELKTSRIRYGMNGEALQ